MRGVVALVACSQVAALLGDLVLAEIVDRHPTLLIALNPRNRNLALATTQLNAVPYYLVGFCRLVASDPLYFLLGYWYGERAIRWVERRSRTYGPFVRDGEQYFRRFSYPLIFFAPNSFICALSAASGVRLGTFILLNVSGTFARLMAIRQLGFQFGGVIEAIVGFIADHRIPILIISAIGVAWTIFGEFRGNNSELDTLRSLIDDEDSSEGDPDAADSTSNSASGADDDSGIDGSTDSDHSAPQPTTDAAPRSRDDPDPASTNGTGPEPTDVPATEPSTGELER